MPKIRAPRLAAAAVAVVCLAPALASAQAVPPLDHFWCYGITDDSPNASHITRVGPCYFEPGQLPRLFATTRAMIAGAFLRRR